MRANGLEFLNGSEAPRRFSEVMIERLPAESDAARAERERAERDDAPPAPPPAPGTQAAVCFAALKRRQA